MATLRKLIGDMHATQDFHVRMAGTNPLASFRSREFALATGPEYVDGKEIWLLEVAKDSDWNGQKKTRSPTSCGIVFSGGIRLYGCSRTATRSTPR